MYLFTRSKIVTVSALFTSLFVVGTAIGPAQASAPSQPPASTIVKLADANAAPDQASAMAVAQKYAHPVVDESKTTETSQISALPDGSMQLVTNTLPVRVKQAGKWVPVDVSLKSAGDVLVPAATSVPVQFSAGGSGTMAKVQTSTGQWVTESWPYGDLPTPSISGATATYASVLPGVDLKLAATVTGMSEVLVVKNATAAADPRVTDLSLAIGGASVAAAANGTTIASAADGSTLTSSAPTWWDSSKPGADASGPAHGDTASPVAKSVTAKGQVVLQARTITGDNSVTYPLYIDPDWSGGVFNYWYIDRGYPNSAFVNGATSRAVEKLGHASIANSSDGVEHLARDFWQMNIGGVVGKHILAAQFSVTQVYAGSCAPTGFGVYQLSPSGLAPGQTWNTSPAGVWPANPFGSSNTTMGRTGCSPTLPAGAIGFDATSTVASVAGAGQGSLYVGMRALNESVDTGYKEFAQSASLTVTYNTPPNIPSNPVFSSPSRVCGTATSPVGMPGTQPITLQATVTDADAGTNVNAVFYVVNGTTLAPVASYGWPQQAQGTAQVTIPANTLSTGFYAWHADAGDNIDLSPGYSPYCYFNIVNSPPGVPGVVQTSIGTPNVGLPMTVEFTSTPSDGVAVYAYWWEPGPAASPSPAPPVTAIDLGSAIPASGYALGPVRYVRPDASSTNATGVIVAPIDRTATLWVASYNWAGAVSQDATGYAAAGLPVATSSDTDGVSFTAGHEWNTDFSSSPLGSSITDSNTTSARLDLYTGHDGIDLTATSEVLGAPATPVISMPGYTALIQSWGGTPGSEVVPLPAGYTVNSNRLGQLVAVPPNGGPPPSGTVGLYRCGSAATAYFASTSATCEGVAGSALLLGYIYTSLAVMPANVSGPAVQLLRCHSGTNTHLMSIAAVCPGSWTLEATLGYMPSGVWSVATVNTSFDFTHSFTVSAWVNPSLQMLPGRAYTAIAQVPYLPTTGVNATLALGINSDGHSSMCVSSSTSSAVTAMDCAVGPTIPVDTWSMVTGIWDASNQQVRLLINDAISPAAVQPHVVPSGQVASTYPFMVGQGWAHNMPQEQWNGMIDDPAVFPGVISSSQLDNLFNQLPPQ